MTLTVCSVSWLRCYSSHVNQRARSVLYAVVREFIETGEPVGSRTLAKKYGFDLSPATIRNVLSDLEDAEYLTQPHPSAGRTPTEAAFRLFIDALMQVRQLTSDESARIEQLFGAHRAGSELYSETSRLLSELTGSASLLIRSRIEHRTLLKIQFIQTRPDELLSVLVFSDGTVENRFIPAERQLSAGELETLHNMLADAVEGRTLGAVRDLFSREVEQRRDELAELRRFGESLLDAAMAGSTREVVIAGHAKLLNNPDFASAERMRELMTTLEQSERLMHLLDQVVSSERVQVFLGDDVSNLGAVSVVAARYGEADRPTGVVGVIGPTRMDYPGVVPVVQATADAMTAALSRDGGREDAARPVDGED